MAIKNPFSGFVRVHDKDRGGVYGPKEGWLNPAAIASVTRVDPRGNDLLIEMVNGKPPALVSGDEAVRILKFLGGKIV